MPHEPHAHDQCGKHKQRFHYPYRAEMIHHDLSIANVTGFATAP
jgi:hypothetical protein